MLISQYAIDFECNYNLGSFSIYLPDLQKKNLITMYFRKMRPLLSKRSIEFPRVFGKILETVYSYPFRSNGFLKCPNPNQNVKLVHNYNGNELPGERSNLISSQVGNNFFKTSLTHVFHTGSLRVRHL